MSRWPSLSLAGALAGCLVLSVCLPASAQTLLVRVSEGESGRPILGAFVTLRDGQGTEIRSALTNTQGRFLFDLPGPGAYTIRAQMMGRETQVTAPIPVEAGEAAVQDLRMAVRAIELEGIAVEGSRRCRLRPSEGEATAAVWDEARKALEVVAWGLREEVFWYELEHRSREYGPGGRQVLQESSETLSGYFREPFHSLPAEDLVRGGFLRDTLAYAPDAAVLLSDAFLDGHCFRIETGDRDRVGLAFEPVDRRSPADIEGTLWLDQGGSRLRFLEFSYVGSLAESLGRGAGGRVEFEYLPTGAWIVRRWRIRTPVLGATEPLGGRRFVREPGPVGYVEQGGEVLRIRSREGEEIAAADRAILIGSVYDSTLSAPLGGARVRLSGTSWEALTDPEGHFELQNLPSGSYTVEVTHPFLDSLGVAVPPTVVELEPGQATRVDLAVPKHSRTVARAREPVSGSARLAGKVVAQETGQPLASVEVSLPGTGAVTLSDAEGRFQFAMLAPGAHAVRARYLGRGAVEDTVTLKPGESLQIEFRLPVEPISMEGILVEVERRDLRLELTGFFERQIREHGVFITQDRIEERKPAATLDLFQGIPGVRLVRARDGINRQVTLVGSRAVSLISDPWANPCYPTVWIDDQPYTSPGNEDPIYLDELVGPMEIAAIEIYQTTARIPVKYNVAGACGVIVIWTRRD